MGGRLLTSVFNLPEKRISRAEYEDLRLYLIKEFQDIYFECSVDTPKLLKNKESVGDLDLVVNLQADQVKKVIKEKWNIKPHINANVMSLPIREFQVDIIFVDSKYFHTTLNFYNHGDFGNLCGRLYNGLGANFGSKGLFFKLLRSYFSGNEKDVNPLDKIYITSDIFDILSFLGLDYAKWYEGFDDENDVFNYIESSKFFNPRLFFFEELNHENRTRNKNRPMYCRFVDRVTEKYKDQIIPRISKQYYFPYVIRRWPDILDEIEKHRPAYEKSYIIGKKWGGELVKEVTKLEGPELGNFIIKFKNGFKDFNGWILKTSIQEIKETLQNFHEHFDDFDFK